MLNLCQVTNSLSNIKKNHSEVQKFALYWAFHTNPPTLSIGSVSLARMGTISSEIWFISGPSLSVRRESGVSPLKGVPLFTTIAGCLAGSVLYGFVESFI